MNETALKQMESAHENFRLEVLVIMLGVSLLAMQLFHCDRTSSVVDVYFNPDGYL